MFKLKPQHPVNYEMVNISKFFKDSEKLIVFLPEDKLEAYLVVEYLQNWLDDFAEVIIFATKFQINFLRKLKQRKLVNISDLGITKCKYQDAVILYLNNFERAGKYLGDVSNSLILSAKGAQLEFLPEPESNLKYLEQVAGFLGVHYEPSKLKLSILRNEVDLNMLMKNRFPNFILHFTVQKDKNLKNLVMALKERFSANIHFTANNCKMKDVPNIKILPKLDLLQLCSLADAGELVITDDSALHNLFKQLDLKSILIEDIKDLTNLNARIDSWQKGTF